MAASWELQLISAVVRGDNPPKMYEEALKFGLRFEMFGGDEAKTVWARVEAYFNRPDNPGYIPSEATLKEIFPALDLPTPLENFRDLCKKVRDGHLRRKTDKLIDSFNLGARENVEHAIAELSTGISVLQEHYTSSSDRDFKSDALEEIINFVERQDETAGMTGMPWPWPTLNKDTQGIQKGDLLMFWALPKSMKTWMGLVIAANLYSLGYRVLVYSKEMTWDITRNRLACVLGKINYTSFKNGTLSEEERNSLFSIIENLSSDKHTGRLHFTQADRLDGSPGGPSEIRKKIQAYKPHFVMLDSTYMLEMPNVNGNAMDWKNLTAVMRALKQISKDTGVAILTIMQENETQALKFKGSSRGTASLAFNKLAVADCDLGIKLVINKRKRELSLHYAVAREAMGDGFSINALACENFEECGSHLWEVGDDQSDKEDKAPALPTQVLGSINSGVTLNSRALTMRSRVVAKVEEELAKDPNDETE